MARHMLFPLALMHTVFFLHVVYGGDLNRSKAPITSEYFAPWVNQFVLKSEIPPVESGFQIYDLETGDVDGDGLAELIVLSKKIETCDPSGRWQDISIYRWRFGGPILTFRQNGDATEYPETSRIFCLDLNGDGKREILKNQEIVEFDGTSYQARAVLISPIGFGDTDNDNNLEVVEYGYNVLPLYEYRNGAFAPDGTIPFSNNFGFLLTEVGDCNRDGHNEVVITDGNGNDTGSVSVFSCHYGLYFLDFERRQWLNIFSDIMLTDMDDDRINEIFVANIQDSSIWAFEFNNGSYNQQWNVVFGGYTGIYNVPSLGLGRLDRTGMVKVLAGLGGHCYVPEVGSGVFLIPEGMIFRDSNSYGICSIETMDIDGDLIQDVVAGSTNGTVYFIGLPPANDAYRKLWHFDTSAAIDVPPDQWEDYDTVGQHNYQVLGDSCLHITARKNSWDRVKLRTENKNFSTGLYQWRLWIPPTPEARASSAIAAWLISPQSSGENNFREIDFEIGWGQDSERARYNISEEPNSLLCYMTIQRDDSSGTPKSRGTWEDLSAACVVEAGNWYLLTIDLSAPLGNYIVNWTIQKEGDKSIQHRGPLSCNYGPTGAYPTSFWIYCSVENFGPCPGDGCWIGEQQPAQDKQAIFDYVSFYGTYGADLNNSGVIDSTDLVIQANGLAELTSGAMLADLNQDGLVNVLDLKILELLLAN